MTPFEDYAESGFFQITIEEEGVLYPGSFLVGEVKNYDFTPYNTTVRVEAGQIVEMTRVFVP